MYPEEYSDDFDGTWIDYMSKYNWDPKTGVVLGATVPLYQKTNVPNRRKESAVLYSPNNLVRTDW